MGKLRLLLNYHESVANVDDKGVGVRADAVPFVVDEDLKAANLILLKDCQGSGVTVRASPKC